MTLFAEAIVAEHRYRIERSERRAQLCAALGPAPAVQRLRPLARRVVPLAGPIVIQHGQDAWEPRKAA